MRLVNQLKEVRENMDSEKNRRYQAVMVSNYHLDTHVIDRVAMPDEEADILTMLHNHEVLMVNSRRRNGLILFKKYHAEFAGPGAVVGGDYDRDCQRVLAIGNLSLLSPESHEDRQKAFLIRRQWIRLIKQITENHIAHERVQKILDQFEQWFTADIVAQLPDEAFANLVGVLPQTVAIVRRFGSDVDNY
ncbi:hypothetical protein B6N60_00800 [Richelia sinica FACHB-800]|uniref:Uncharacterized protein n=2 Tax=Richelia TaxID=98443 RepID=A0A975T4W4_9NOST|nr:hypothetical protein B6N60_00800 [Richelia sinica FACHB-800]